jgi:hypothetical protein
MTGCDLQSKLTGAKAGDSTKLELALCTVYVHSWLIYNFRSMRTRKSPQTWLFVTLDSTMWHASLTVPSQLSAITVDNLDTTVRHVKCSVLTVCLVYSHTIRYRTYTYINILLANLHHVRIKLYCNDPLPLNYDGNREETYEHAKFTFLPK